MGRTCDYGHPWEGPATSRYGNRRRCPACQRARARREYDTRHAGHDVVTIAGTTTDGWTRRRCLTCSKPGPRAYYPPEADDGAVLRATQGDPPTGLNVTERRAAILQLHGELSGSQIAERIGISPRTVWRHLATARTETAA